MGHRVWWTKTKTMWIPHVWKQIQTFDGREGKSKVVDVPGWDWKERGIYGDVVRLSGEPVAPWLFCHSRLLQGSFLGLSG